MSYVCVFADVCAGSEVAKMLSGQDLPLYLPLLQPLPHSSPFSHADIRIHFHVDTHTNKQTHTHTLTQNQRWRRGASPLRVCAMRPDQIMCHEGRCFRFCVTKGGAFVFVSRREVLSSSLYRSLPFAPEIFITPKKQVLEYIISPQIYNKSSNT